MRLTGVDGGTIGSWKEIGHALFERLHVSFGASLGGDSDGWATEDSFSPDEAVPLMDSLRHNLEIGDAESAHFRAVELGIVLQALAVPDGPGRQAKIDSLRALYNKLAANVPRSVLPEDPGATAALFALAIREQNALTAGDYRAAQQSDGKILNALRGLIVRRMHEMLVGRVRRPAESILPLTATS